MLKWLCLSVLCLVALTGCSGCAGWMTSGSIQASDTTTITQPDGTQIVHSKNAEVESAGGTEEAPEAYKNVNEVVHVVHEAGISRRVCRMRPLGVIKG